ncbi:LuxR C-terminal-related transcriptional regulator [Bradyrhizobium sp. NAS80.1]|uniref:response regulator transcription factor n=1 Tax=Bradyrhizobium sp. NAS80.1 TaxID=1680159 RepID=UPI00143D6B97|nr:LuxR C-terminal-related transcriptional regulator [Bradyrhizobium sp. NAS80.1]
MSSLHAVTNEQLRVIDARLWSNGTELHQGSTPTNVTQGDPIDSHLLKQLSAREVAILDRIVRGDSNKHVALHFKIAEPTVKAHVKAIFRKISVTNRTQAAIWAMNHRLNVSSGTEGIAEDLHGAQELNGSIGSNGASAV